MPVAKSKSQRRRVTAQSAPKGELNIIPADFISVITAEIASELLENGLNMRSVNRRRVASLARMIQEGYWEHANGETIKLDQEGRLVDGQHRLLACIEANEPIQSYVVQVDSVEEVDRSQARTAGQLIGYSLDVGDLNAWQTTASRAMLYEKAGRSFHYRGQTSVREVQEYAAKHKGLIEDSIRVARTAQGYWTRGQLSTLRVICARNLGDMGLELFDYFLAQVNGSVPTRKGDPARTLRETWVRLTSGGSTGRGHVSFQVGMILLMRLFNAFCQNKPVLRSFIKGKASDDKIPALVTAREVDAAVALRASQWAAQEAADGGA